MGWALSGWRCPGPQLPCLATGGLGTAVRGREPAIAPLSVAGNVLVRAGCFLLSLAVAEVHHALAVTIRPGSCASTAVSCSLASSPSEQSSILSVLVEPPPGTCHLCAHSYHCAPCPWHQTDFIPEGRQCRHHAGALGCRCTTTAAPAYLSVQLLWAQPAPTAPQQPARLPHSQARAHPRTTLQRQTHSQAAGHTHGAVCSVPATSPCHQRSLFSASLD